MLSAMLIAMLTAITVWWLLIQRLKDKPWTTQGVLKTSRDTVTSSAPKVGLWVFLAVVSSLFGLFASAYMMRSRDTHGGIASWQALDEPGVLWINTVVLVLASAAMQIARNRAQQEELSGVRGYFTLAGVLTAVFLAGQIVAWRQLSAAGYGPGSPAFTFFVLLTGAHGLHMVGGLWVLVRTTVRLWLGLDKNSVVARSNLRLSVELCTTYWHWLLLVWLGLFALLLST
jgi:cytochrome c oxidase subunit 3